MGDVSGIVELLKELREFSVETSVNFGTLKRETNELQEDHEAKINYKCKNIWKQNVKILKVKP